MYNEEVNYIIFILGYDLLQDRFKNLESNECDTVYEICRDIAVVFLLSDEYHMSNISMYEALVKWIENHEETIAQLIKSKR